MHGRNHRNILSLFVRFLKLPVLYTILRIRYGRFSPFLCSKYFFTYWLIGGKRNCLLKERSVLPDGHVH